MHAEAEVANAHGLSLIKAREWIKLAEWQN